MTEPNAPRRRTRRNWLFFSISLVIVLAAAALHYVTRSDQRGLLWLALYTVPSHVFVSPFPHEPILLYWAKYYPALQCALASLLGCLVAGMWDYWVVMPLVRHPGVRSRYVRSPLYRRSVALFRKSPFWALVVLGLTPLPFYPVKFLSMADGYPLPRYLLALVVGRTPRYYGIAYLGYVLKLPNWVLVVLAFSLFLFAVYKSRTEKDLPEDDAPSDGASASVAAEGAPSDSSSSALRS